MQMLGTGVFIVKQQWKFELLDLNYGKNSSKKFLLQSLDEIGFRLAAAG